MVDRVEPGPSSRLVLLLSLLLAGTLAALASLYPRARLPLFEERDRPLVERTQTWAASIWHVPKAEVERESFAIVMRSQGRICVELRPWRRHKLGGALVCRDSMTGKPIEERIGTADF